MRSGARSRGPLPWLALLLLAGCASSTQLSAPEVKAYEVALAAVDANHLAMAWHGAAGDQRDAVYLRYVHGNGQPAGDVLRLTDGSRRAYEPSLQMLDGDAVVGWYERDDAARLTAFVARFSAEGQARWRVRLSPASLDGRNVVVRVGSGGVHVAWIQQVIGDEDGGTHVHYGRLDADGQWVEPQRDAGRADRDTWNLNAALDASGTFFVVYDARGRSAAKELQLLRIADGGAQQVQLSMDDGKASLYPDLALAAGRAALTWFDERDGNQEVYLFAGSLADLESAVDARARRITDTPGHSIGAYLSWNGPRIGLAWCDDSGGRHRVYAQQFDARGVALGAAQALTDGKLQGLIPSIVPWARGFAVGWNEMQADEDAHGHGGIRSSIAALRIIGPAGNPP